MFFINKICHFFFYTSTAIKPCPKTEESNKVSAVANLNGTHTVTETETITGAFFRRTGAPFTFEARKSKPPQHSEL